MTEEVFVMSNPTKIVSDFYTKESDSAKRRKDSAIRGILDVAIEGTSEKPSIAKMGRGILDVSDAIFGAISSKIPSVNKPLFKSLENAIEMGDLTIPELLITRKVFKKSVSIRTTINAIVRKYRSV